MNILREEGISVDLTSVSKREAIIASGKKMFELGYVNQNYELYMLEREDKTTTFIGNGVAIPHGTLRGKGEVINAGIVIHQYPNGIDFGGGNIAYFVIGVAGKNDEHIEIISNLADIIEEEERVIELSRIKDA